VQGEEVEALRIREEDLRKLHPSQTPTSHKPERTRKVVVRRTNPLAPEELPRPKHRGCVRSLLLGLLIVSYLQFWTLTAQQNLQRLVLEG